jgi:hypothetical protein
LISVQIIAQQIKKKLTMALFRPLQGVVYSRQSISPLPAAGKPRRLVEILETSFMWSNLKTLVQYVRRHPPSRLMVYGLLVGLVSGIGASLFLVALEWLTFFFGHEPIFATSDITFTDPRELLIYNVLGLICVPVGWLRSRSL